ncbi:unnamed protein product [Mortierella alpina]
MDRRRLHADIISDSTCRQPNATKKKRTAVHHKTTRQVVDSNLSQQHLTEKKKKDKDIQLVPRDSGTRQELISNEGSRSAEQDVRTVVLANQLFPEECVKCLLPKYFIFFSFLLYV